jgi:hypothetical protein
VMICESSPIHNGGASNASNWNEWYAPYFNKFEAFPHLKGLIYISDPWDRQGWWEGWDDSRINTYSTAAAIRTNYASELGKSKYIHMEEYLRNPLIIGSSSTNIKGDVNGDGVVDLTDTILALKAISANPSGEPIHIESDVDSDGKMGLAEAIYILQYVGGLRENRAQ